MRDELERFAYLVVGAGDAELDPHRLTVFAKVALLHAVSMKVVVQHPPDEVEVGFQVIGVSDFLECDFEQFLLGVTSDLTEGVVDLKPAPSGDTKAMPMGA